jgi:hypothetical protein
LNEIAPPHQINRSADHAKKFPLAIFACGGCDVERQSKKEVVMKRYALSLALCLLFASGGFAQTKSPVEGVWKITEWIESGKTNTNPQPGLIIFTKDYYSVAMLMGPPRTDSIPNNMGRDVSDAEKIGLYEQWKWFVGMSGSYEVKESRVVLRPLVAKTTWDMSKPNPQGSEFRLEGSNTLWLIPTGARKVGLRMKLTRLE